MTMRKTGDAEKVGVAYFGEEAGIVNSHLQKVGKSVLDFNEEEKKALDSDLEEFRASNDQPVEAEPEADVANNEDDKE